MQKLLIREYIFAATWLVITNRIITYSGILCQSRSYTILSMTILSMLYAAGRLLKLHNQPHLKLLQDIPQFFVQSLISTLSGTMSGTDILNPRLFDSAPQLLYFLR